MAHIMGTNRGQPQVPTRATRGLSVAAIDPIPIFREGLAVLMQRAQGLQWAGYAASHHSALQLCEQVRPDVLLLDSGMDPQCHLLRLLVAGDTSMSVVVLVRESTRTAEYLTCAIATGAHGVVLRSGEPRRVAEAIHRAHTDRRFVDPALTALIARPKRQPVPDNGDGSGPARGQMPLSRREYQVLQLVAEGMENSAIAKVLYLSVETVRTHVKSILRKLSARDRTHAVTTAFRSGLLVIHPDDSLKQPVNSRPERTSNTVA
ncbi:DNA-binding response regulator, NarL/FixJ family, contains REC and HTH domains [Amycolatopsis marina]|uniref:DNA-binding response regulator, NarL/FixJ family, contains REC and HTH domains n=1 Tax=Amycolatopsis marina TaxID=490629 RepID=A0A1I0VR05_9PSEU|nr:response regulator transcription factor [Amycolatopsis marina]SFA78423.1 DNA-binding response regulator, NarL/FixJ family, contains REC and HTH domains [Amycolatopsis marina]